MSQYAYVHVYHTHPYNLSAPLCYSSTAAFNDCNSELMPYTVLANSWCVSAYDTYQCQAMHINDKNYSCHITAVELVPLFLQFKMPHKNNMLVNNCDWAKTSLVCTC